MRLYRKRQSYRLCSQAAGSGAESPSPGKSSGCAARPRRRAFLAPPRSGSPLPASGCRPGHKDPLGVRPRVGRSQHSPAPSIRVRSLAASPSSSSPSVRVIRSHSPAVRGRTANSCAAAAPGSPVRERQGSRAHSRPTSPPPSRSSQLCRQVQDLQFSAHPGRTCACVAGHPVPGELPHNHGFTMGGHRSGLSHDAGLDGEAKSSNSSADLSSQQVSFVLMYCFATSAVSARKRNCIRHLARV